MGERGEGLLSLCQTSRDVHLVKIPGAGLDGSL